MHTIYLNIMSDFVLAGLCQVHGKAEIMLAVDLKKCPFEKMSHFKISTSLTHTLGFTKHPLQVKMCYMKLELCLFASEAVPSDVRNVFWTNILSLHCFIC